MHTAAASALNSVTRGRMRPPSCATDSITSGTPWPLVSGAKYRVINPTHKPPNASTGIVHRPPIQPESAPPSWPW